MKPEEHQLLSRIGPGTPMGALLRRYWMPACLSRELEAEGAPLRVRLMGEDLIAFRDGDGRVGLLGEHCAHRGASLYFGKNTEGGLRCWYHGWKYDRDGNCVDQPNEPPQTRFCDKVKQTAYPCVERNGAVWTYMGPPESKPPLPDLEWLLVRPSHAYASKRLQECNWMQAMDGGLDPIHISFLHGSETFSRATEHKGFVTNPYLADRNPKIDVAATKGGLLHGARREADEKHHYWRIGNWFMPNFTMAPGFPGDAPLGGHAWVPIDDAYCWAYEFSWHPTRPLAEEELKFMREGSPTSLHSMVKPGTFTPLHNKSNGYAEPNPTETQPWQQIKIIQDQDCAVTESMGTLYDRTREVLGSTDVVLQHVRRRLLAGAKSLAEGREPAIDATEYRRRPFSCLLPRDVPSWPEAVAEPTDARPETFRPSL